MAVIDTGLTQAGLREEFFDSFRDATVFYKDLSTPIKSSLPVEQYRWLTELPRMREWGTGRIAKGLRTETYDVANRTYEATIEVDRDELSDDQTGQIRLKINQL